MVIRPLLICVKTPELIENPEQCGQTSEILYILLMFSYFYVFLFPTCYLLQRFPSIQRKKLNRKREVVATKNAVQSFLNYGRYGCRSVSTIAFA